MTGIMRCEQCSNPIGNNIPGTPSKHPELKRKVQTPKRSQTEEGPDGKASWIVAFAAFMINFIMAGLSRMSGILFVAFIEMFKVDRKSASMPFSVRSSTMNLLGPVVGVLGQKYGVRKVSVIGGIVGTISAMACYFGDNILWLTILWGGLNGVGTALVTTLTTVIVGQYFDKFKTTAAGISFSGACIGSFIFPPLIEFLLHFYGLSGSFLIVAGITMHCIPAAMILRKPSWVKRANKMQQAETIKQESKENKEKSIPNQSNESDGDLAKKLDLNYLRTNSELVVKLMTTDISSTDEKCVVFPPEDDILREMEDVYSFIGKNPELQSSEVSPDPRNELVTTPVRGNNYRSDRLLSVDDNFHTPVRKVQSSYSVLQSFNTSPCKPFITSKLGELYNKSENMIMDHFTEKNRYTRVLQELKTLHKVYEAIKKRKIFSANSPLLTPSKLVPKIQNLKKATASSGIWSNIVNSIKLHGNPLFLLVSLCRAVHFFTFIPAITIIVDYAMDKGLKEEDGLYVIATLSVGDLFGRLGLGWVTDRGFITLPKYMLIVMVLQGMCTAAFPLIKRKLTLLPLTCAYSLLQGSVFVRHSVLISKYMKPEEQSIAQGCVNFFAGLSGFAVPYYVGFFRDTMGSYDWIFYINGAVGATAGFLWIFEPFFVKLTNRTKELPKADVQVV